MHRTQTPISQQIRAHLCFHRLSSRSLSFADFLEEYHPAMCRNTVAHSAFLYLSFTALGTDELCFMEAISGLNQRWLSSNMIVDTSSSHLLKCVQDSLIGVQQKPCLRKCQQVMRMAFQQCVPRVARRAMGKMQLDVDIEPPEKALLTHKMARQV